MMANLVSWLVTLKNLRYAGDVRVALDGKTFWGWKIIFWRAGYHKQKTSPDERAPVEVPSVDGIVRGEKRVFEMRREEMGGEGEEHAVSGEDDKLGGSCQTGGGR